MDLASLLSDFASAFNDASRILKLRFGEGSGIAEDALLPEKLTGHEQLSGHFRYTLDCLSPDAALELKYFQGQIAELSILEADGSERRVNGIVTHTQQLGADGGFARYQLVLQPALALLEQRTNSRAFQDMSVPEIVTAILDEHIAANPVIAAAFNHDNQLSQDYPQRSYCLQYRESDFAFITRLLREEGISYRYAFSEDDNSPMHTLVLFDDAYSLEAQRQENIRFHNDNPTEEADGITQWLGARLVNASASGLASYDYKPVTTHLVQAMSSVDTKEAPQFSNLEWYDPQTQYYGSDNTNVQRYATLRQNARDLKSKSFMAQSNVRGMSHGAWFQLDEHPVHDQDAAGERQFVVTQMDFEVNNNLGLIEKADAATESQPYQNTFTAVRRGIPIVPTYKSDHAKPTAKGMQTATVVGPAEEEIYTDEYGRIKLQFHWQRSQDHPQGTAQFDDTSSTWVRVMHSWAGANWGCKQIPRVGQEVQVGFIEDDIDRPIVMGLAHNGRLMPPTFSGAGTLPANKTLSGIKTKEYKGSLYNELLLDDTTNETRAKLSSEHGKTQLNQGFLIHPRTEGKGEPRGEGFELRTDEAGAVRAAKGMIISADARGKANGKQLDRQELLSQVKAANDLANTLADHAEHQLANRTETGKQNKLIDGDKQTGKDAKSGHQQHLMDAIESLEKSTNTDPNKSPSPSQGEGRGEGQKNQGGGQPLIGMHAPAGLAIITPNAATISTGTNYDQIAQRDNQHTTGRRWIHNVGESMSLFVSGQSKKIKETMKLIAAKGKIQMQAQSDEIEWTADQAMKITSIKNDVTAAAAKDITMTSGGGYIKLGGGNIDVHCPGTVSIKCAKLEIEGPVSMGVAMPDLPLAEPPKNWIALHLLDPETQEGVPRRPYTIHFNGGAKIEGQLNEAGQAKHHNVPTEGVKRVIYHPRDPKKEVEYKPLNKLLE